MFTVLRQRDFGLLWAAGLISTTGDWLLFVALPFYVYQRSGSTLATGAMFIAQMTPPLLLGSVAGVFVDRWDRRRIMIVADLARAVLLLALLTVHGHADLPRIYVVAFLLAALGQLFGPVKGALIPRLVEGPHLVQANALNALGDNIPRLVGPAVGGLLFGMFGLPAAVLADSVSFLVSGLLIASIRVPPIMPVGAASVPQVGATWIAVWREWRAGLRLVGADRTLRTLLSMEGLAIVGQGILDVLLVPFVKRALHGDAQVFGWLLTVQAIGGLLGGLVIAQRGAAVAPTRLFGLSLGLTGIILVTVANVSLLPLVFALVALAGLPVVGWLVAGQTLLQGSTTDTYRGRVLGAYGTTSALTRLGGMGLASVLGDRLGIVPLITVSGALHVVAAVGALVLLRAARLPLAPTEDVPTRTD